MRKRYLVAAALACAMLISGCGTTAETSEPETESREEISASETVSSETASEEEVSSEEEEDSEDSEESSEEDTESTESKAELKYSEFKPADGLSTKYADLDNRSFVYDGKLFKLGEATLADFIDAGFPFSESELKNADNNLNQNHETSPYTVDLTDLTHMQLSFTNMKDDSITEKEAVLTNVRWYATYTPHDDYDESLNAQIYENINKSAEIVSFAFPLWLQKDELLANSPDPTKNDEYGNVSYTVDSTVYYGGSGYTFEFDTKNNQLENVYISWLP